MPEPSSSVLEPASPCCWLSLHPWQGVSVGSSPQVPARRPAPPLSVTIVRLAPGLALRLVHPGRRGLGCVGLGHTLGQRLCGTNRWIELGLGEPLGLAGKENPSCFAPEVCPARRLCGTTQQLAQNPAVRLCLHCKQRQGCIAPLRHLGRQPCGCRPR